MRIVIIDGHTLNPGDLSWAPLRALGEVDFYPRSAPEQVVDRCKDAQVIITNKIRFQADLLAQLPHLRYIAISATGYDHIDLTACKERGIRVTNVAGYSTQSVAQHCFALLLNISNAVEKHHQSVLAGHWSKQPDFSYSLQPLQELAGKTMGIFGFGKIGQALAKIALGFDMRVIAHHKHPQRDAMEGVTFVAQERLFQQSDVLSLHVPLNAQTKGVINKKTLALMKPNAILINTGRGGLIVEEDLAIALKNQQIQAAALDVLSQEPPLADHILFGLPNCIITPHHAWASVAARQRLINSLAEQISHFKQGEAQPYLV